MVKGTMVLAHKRCVVYRNHRAQIRSVTYGVPNDEIANEYCYDPVEYIIVVVPIFNLPSS